MESSFSTALVTPAKGRTSLPNELRPGFVWDALRMVALSYACFWLVTIAAIDRTIRSQFGFPAPWTAIQSPALHAAVGIVAFALASVWLAG